MITADRNGCGVLLVLMGHWDFVRRHGGKLHRIAGDVMAVSDVLGGVVVGQEVRIVLWQDLGSTSMVVVKSVLRQQVGSVVFGVVFRQGRVDILLLVRLGHIRLRQWFFMRHCWHRFGVVTHLWHGTDKVTLWHGGDVVSSLWLCVMHRLHRGDVVSNLWLGVVLRQRLGRVQRQMVGVVRHVFLGVGVIVGVDDELGGLALVHERDQVELDSRQADCVAMSSA